MGLLVTDAMTIQRSLAALFVIAAAAFASPSASYEEYLTKGASVCKPMAWDEYSQAIHSTFGASARCVEQLYNYFAVSESRPPQPPHSDPQNPAKDSAFFKMIVKHKKKHNDFCQYKGKPEDQKCASKLVCGKDLGGMCNDFACLGEALLKKPVPTFFDKCSNFKHEHVAQVTSGPHAYTVIYKQSNKKPHGDDIIIDATWRQVIQETRIIRAAFPKDRLPDVGETFQLSIDGTDVNVSYPLSSQSEWNQYGKRFNTGAPTAGQSFVMKLSESHYPTPKLPPIFNGEKPADGKKYGGIGPRDQTLWYPENAPWFRIPVLVAFRRNIHHAAESIVAGHAWDGTEATASTEAGSFYAPASSNTEKIQTMKC